jgi:hypothetical protein
MPRPCSGRSPLVTIARMVTPEHDGLSGGQIRQWVRRIGRASNSLVPLARESITLPSSSTIRPGDASATGPVGLEALGRGDFGEDGKQARELNCASWASSTPAARSSRSTTKAAMSTGVHYAASLLAGAHALRTCCLTRLLGDRGHFQSRCMGGGANGERPNPLGLSLLAVVARGRYYTWTTAFTVPIAVRVA